MPPTSARAGLFADAAPPVNVETAAVLALVGAAVGMVVGTMVVAGAADAGLLVAGAEEAGEATGGADDAGATEGGAQVVDVVGFGAAGVETAGAEAASEETDETDDDRGPQVADDAWAVETATAVVCRLVVVLTTVVVWVVVVDDEDQTPQVVGLEAGTTVTGVELLLLGTTGVDDHTAHDSYDEVLLVVVDGFTGVGLEWEATEDDDHTAQVSDETELVLVLDGFTDVDLGVEAAGDEDHTAHVSEDAVLLGDVCETGLGDVWEDDVSHTPQDEEAGVALLVVAGEDGVEDVLLVVGDDDDDGVAVVPQLPHEADGEEALATAAVVDGDAFVLPSQVPQEAGADSDSQLPQLADAPRCSSTPPTTELAKAKRTNELFTMVAEWVMSVATTYYATI